MRMSVEPRFGHSAEFPFGLWDLDTRTLIGWYATEAEANHAKTLYEMNFRVNWSDDDEPEDDDEPDDDDDEDLPADMIEPDDEDDEYDCEDRSRSAELIDAHGNLVAETLRRMLTIPGLADTDRNRLEQLSLATMSARLHHHPVRAHEEAKAALAEAETIAKRYEDAGLLTIR